MIFGVTQGFEKNLELVGTGYRVIKQADQIVLSLGFSHQIEYTPPPGVTINLEGNNKINIQGINKQLVGQVAAIIRSFKKPEPYKGKGIRYQDEIVRRKAGKAAKAAAA
jgi:large subunit ribosomal protein L6